MDRKKKQKAACRRLKQALDACHEVGLRGGGYDSSFWVWPADAVPDPRDCGREFFEQIGRSGGMKIETEMLIDGGAGV